MFVGAYVGTLVLMREVLMVLHPKEDPKAKESRANERLKAHFNVAR